MTKVHELFCALSDFATARGAKSVKDLPGCWEAVIGPRGKRWFIALNGHEMKTPCSTGNQVPPFSFYVEWNGWPAGVIDYHDGVFAAGSKANEDALLAALREAK